MTITNSQHAALAAARAPAIARCAQKSVWRPYVALSVAGLLALGFAPGRLAPGRAEAQEPASTPEQHSAAHGGWQVEVELSPAPEQAGDPWSARTVLGPESPPERPEPTNVAWLAGLQRQASHLGMGPEANAAQASDGASEPSIFARGITRIVKTIPMLGRSVRDMLGSPMAWGASERDDDFGTGFVQGTAVNASFAPPSKDRVRTVSVLPGAERRREAASSQPCSSEACYGPSLIKWQPALAACTKDVRIGVIDTSFDLGHPAFKRLRVVRKEFIDGAHPSDEDWHGTAILSLLAGDPASGTPGLIPDATFLLATAFRSDAAGNASTDPERLLQALDWLDKLDVDVVNMSFSGPPDSRIATAIERMSLKGVMFVAAAGNMGPTAPPSYPGAYSHVIAVTAVNRNRETYRNANRGDYIDVAAPGVDVLTALPNGKQGLQTGTSFAVPFVTAILATRAASGIVEGTEDLLLERIARRDLGSIGRDSVYGIGLALAPEQCAGTSLVAQSPSAKKAKKRQAPLRAGVADIRW